MPESGVAIVGAGVAGAAAAIRLAERGVPVDLYEAVPEPRPIGAGLLLQPTGQRVLAAMGLLDEALALGTRVDRLFGDTPSGRAVLDMSYRRFHPEAYGLGMQRGALMGMLWRRLRELGVRWHCGAAAEGFEQDADGVTLRLAHRAPVRHAALILANGSFSRLREGMRVAQHGRPFPWGAVWTVLPAPAGFPQIELRQRFRSASQMIGLMPVGKAHAGDPERGINLFWSLPLSELEGWQERMGLDRLKQQMAALFPEVSPLLAGLRDSTQLREARYADVWMSRWHDGRVLAIGDCAHGMSPQLGQGANMALIDAHELTCEAAGDWPGVFERYSRRRRAHLRFYGQASKGLTPMFQSHAVVAPWLRDRFFGWGGKLPYIHQQSIATLAGVKTGWLWARLKL
ncbi:2-polyprenyl-6-methoxyphenol hydroxylase-like FAD-dependent oxidoreductase [Pelomonas aquatica]|uniref:2-polyprenyl-6-methoxyphenol hydroxylase-like FAD-dependent oxidoreductase n=1 Tax=Pelomonas aquatica TaxID=431058 RepID=A0ABU1Z4H0_9BURK|nr:NAD(P)/FAD-dependent oxidoreductase [Pelomonas aquatica]MDR7294916.1 2-polyprenyl-6-methoxyphenol hydroxylase-like FAD-dependent oxidoreductase [Pelomonas aquatica]